VRVADNEEVNDLPPDLGALPLFACSQYKDKLPEAMASKGGFFMPMYRTCHRSRLLLVKRKHADYLYLQSERRCGSASSRLSRSPSRYTLVA